MMSSRRGFLGTFGAVLAASRGISAGQGLEQFATGGLPCEAEVRATPPVPRDATYQPGAPLRTSLIEPGLSGVRLTLTGLVAGLSCGPIARAELEFWQADHRGVYDMSAFRLRGRQLTDAAGRYRLMTIMPGASAARAPHLGLHVRVPGKTEVWTELFFPGDPANARDARFHEDLVVKMTAVAPERIASFDVRLNL